LYFEVVLIFKNGEQVLDADFLIVWQKVAVAFFAFASSVSEKPGSQVLSHLKKVVHDFALDEVRSMFLQTLNFNFHVFDLVIDNIQGLF
jgi:hypothetical protein